MRIGPPSALGLHICTIALIAVTAPRLSRSEPPSDKPRFLMIASEAEAEASQEAIFSLRAQLSDVGIDFRVAWVPAHTADLHAQADIVQRLAEEHAASVVFWSDLLTGDRIFLYVSEPGGGRILVRSVSLGDQGDRFEVIAVIVRTVVEAIVDGGHIGVSPRLGDTAPRPTDPSPVASDSSGQHTSSPDKAHEDSEPSRRPPRRERRRGRGTSPARLDLAAAYALTLYSPTKWVIHGVRLGLAVRITRRGRIYTAYRIQIPFDVENGLAAMTLRHHPFEAGVAWRFGRGSLFWDMGAGIVTDPLTWGVDPVDDSRIAPTRSRSRWLVGAAPFVRAGWSPIDLFKLYLAAGVDVYFNESPSYVERMDGGRAVVVDPFDARAQIRLGVVFFLF